MRQTTHHEDGTQHEDIEDYRPLALVTSNKIHFFDEMEDDTLCGTAYINTDTAVIVEPIRIPPDSDVMCQKCMKKIERRERQQIMDEIALHLDLYDYLEDDRAQFDTDELGTIRDAIATRGDGPADGNETEN